MPIYEFKCEKCGTVFDIYRSIAAVGKPQKARVPCKLCDGKAVRVTSLPAPPQFRGSGFYATDYKEK